MNNERGGILSKLFVIPVGVALMVGFFFLGYYVGKYQSKSSAQAVIVPPLPDISKDLPKQEEFTFYKTLTDKENKTVSIDLKPKTAEKNAEKKQVTSEETHNTSTSMTQKEQKAETKNDKTAQPAVVRETEVKKKPVVAMKEPKATASANTRIRYTLQIASYQDRGLADEDVKKMKTQGYAAFVVTSQVPDKGTWYRVRVGSFSNKTSAEKLKKEIHAKAGVSTIIVIE